MEKAGDEMARRESEMTKKRVITYQLAYLSNRQISLCEAHNNDADAGCSIGPVQHGLHDGYCDAEPADDDDFAERD